MVAANHGRGIPRRWQTVEAAAFCGGGVWRLCAVEVEEKQCPSVTIMITVRSEDIVFLFFVHSLHTQPMVNVLFQVWTDSARCRAEAVCARAGKTTLFIGTRKI
jgi:hypothetical protein